jgi:DNA-binding transcriptional regulator YdaS (Cro superfamily)
VKIDEYLKKHGINQARLARRCSIHEATISRFKMGLINPSAKLLLMIEWGTQGEVTFRDFPSNRLKDELGIPVGVGDYESDSSGI